MVEISLQDKFDETLDRWRENPVSWMEQVLGITPWEKQREVTEAVLSCRRVSVRSANDVGKSFIAAAITLWYLYCNEGSIVVTTGPSWSQVERIVWGEIRRMWQNARVPLGGRLMNTEIDCTDDKEMKALGLVSPYKHMAVGLSTDDVERFRGIHSDTGKILIVVDEAQGVDEQIYEGIESLMTNQEAKLLLIGNPTRLSGSFYESHRDANRAGLYKKIHISAFDSPNVKLGKVVIPALASQVWVDERKIEWGEGSAQYQSCVLGEFPSTSEDALFQNDWIENAMYKNEVESSDYDPYILAIDVARHGDNDTCYILRKGNIVKWIETRKGKDVTYTVGKAVEMLRDKNIDPDVVVVDDVGVGGGVVDLMMRHYNTVGFIPNNRDEMDEPDTFGNLRMECYWKLKERFRAGQISVPANERLRNELLSLIPEPKEDGKLYMMGKEKMRSQNIRSPDIADALMLSEYGHRLVALRERNRRGAPARPQIFSRTGY